MLCYVISYALILMVSIQLLTSQISGQAVQNAAPRFTTSPVDQRVAENEIASFLCSARGVPTPEVSWYHGGRKIKPNNHRYLIVPLEEDPGTNTRGSVLRVESTKARNEGAYECRAENGVGEAVVAQINLHVYPEGKVPPGYPRITVPPSVKSVEKNWNTELTCTAEGDPEVKVHWFRNYVPIDLSNPRYKLRPSGAFQVMEAQESDEGKYECAAENSLGIKYSFPVSLYVKERVVYPYFSIPPEDAEVIPGENVSLNCVAVGSPMPYVKWRMGARELTLENGEVGLPIGKNVLILTNVRHSANYTCVASSSIGNIESSVEVRVKELPKSPVNVYAREVTSKSARLFWSSSGADPVDSYVIQYRTRTEPWSVHRELTEIKSQSHVITGLEPYTNYELIVMSSNSIGRSLPSDSVEVTTLESAPGSPPMNIRARPVSQTSVSLQWEEPQRANGIITGYTIYYTVTPDTQLSFWSRVSINNTYTASLGDLIANRTYTIAMCALTVVGDGPVSEYIQVRTQKGVPEQPQNFRAEARSDKVIRLTWDPPTRSVDLLDSYEIYCSGAGKTSTETVPASKDSYILGGLLPNTEYSIEMSGKSSVGEGARTAAVIVKTLEAAPSGAPLDINAEAVDSTSLKVTWSAPERDLQNGRITGYRIHYVQTSESGTFEDEAVLALSVPDTEHQFLLTKLKKWTQYRIWIKAFTRSGDGPPSLAVVARTDEDLPGVPTSVRLKALNSTSITVQWRPPKDSDRNGVIRGYYIYYALFDDLRESGKFMRKEISGDTHTETVIDDLRAGSQYQVQVAAYTRKGDGDRSSLRKIRTKEVRGTSLGSPQQLHLRQTATYPPAVTASWAAPKGVEQEPVTYRVEWSAQSSNKDANSQETSDTQFVINNLEYGVEYEFRVAAKNSEGFGEEAVESIKTSEATPLAAPENVTADVVTATSVRLNWLPLPAELSRGMVTRYEIRYSLSSDVIGRSSSSTSATWKVIDGLAAKQNYIVQIRACTEVRCGPWGKSVEFRTHGQYYLDAPYDIRVNREVPTSVLVSWSAPNVSGIVGYRVYCSISADPDVKHWQKFADSEGLSLRVRLNDLLPSSQYYIMVRTKFVQDAYGSWSEIVVIKAQVSSDSYAVRNLRATVITETSVTLHWLSPVESGVAFYVVEYQGDYVKRRKRNVLPMRGERNISSASTLTSFHNLVANVSYTFSITAKFNGGYWGPAKSVRHPNSGDFVAPQNEDEIMNASEDLSLSDADSFKLILILGPVCAGIVVILLIILFVVYCRRKRQVKAVSRPQSKALLGFHVEIPPPYTDGLDPVEMSRLNFNNQAMQQHPAIPVERFAQHFEMLKTKDREKFAQEYESIEPGQTFTWEASNLECNSEKNRYTNVVAYDHSRVILQNGFYGSDYINANHMQGYGGSSGYIATQGPLESTAADFWQMIWEQCCPTIVMMTKLEERNRIKCDRYWPNHGTATYGHINVTQMYIVELATYTMRVFNISQIHSAESRTVHQFQFTAWPDHGVPDHPTPLLQFIRRVKSLTPSNEGPLVVHCSAGVGRTGAYIVIDAMLDRIRQDNLVSIYEFVTHLRAQRNYMVQTEDQYVFIHEALLEAINAGQSEVLAEQLYIHVQQITQFDPEHGCTGVELEFKRLNARRTDQSRFLSANLSCNRAKNRLSSILPYESTRVCLQMIRGVEGSDYINANYIDGYQFKRAYIATQGPMEDTTEDFWRMLWENNCTVVVMLTKLRELGQEKCHQYWPEERPATYKYFAVEPMDRFTSSLYTCREFKVTDVRSGQSRTLRQFQFNEWPEQGVPDSGKGFIEFIGQVQKVRDQYGHDGPITVHCSFGVGRTGVFIALSIVLERMKCEAVVDMFQTVNMLRTQRPEMVQNEDQYAFCLRAALEYLSSFDHYGSPMYSSLQ